MIIEFKGLPVPTLCPPRDADEQARRRTQLQEAITAADARLQEAQEAVENQATAMARVQALEAVRAFHPRRSDTDIQHLEEYTTWMRRPKHEDATMQQALDTLREGWRALQQAQSALQRHDLETAQSQRQRAYLATAAGQAMDQELVHLQRALTAASAVGNERLVRVYEWERDQLRQRFVGAVSAAGHGDG